MRAFFLLVFSVLFATFANAKCIEVKGNQILSVEGKIDWHIFPGPSGYEDVTNGDQPEGAYILYLDKKLCIKDPDSGVIESQTLHLRNEHNFDLRKTYGQKIIVNVADLFGAHTGHHRAPIVASLEKVTIKSSKKSIAKNSLKSSNILAESFDLWEFQDQFGTAVTSVLGFYDALYHAKGEAAQQFLLPSKRNKGGYSISAMNSFYSSLTVPIKLKSIEGIDAHNYKVSYYYELGKKVCNGTSIVAVSRIKNQNLISSVKAQGGC